MPAVRTRAAVWRRAQPLCRQQRFGLEPGAQQRQRVPPEGEPEGGVVGDERLPFRGRAQERLAFAAARRGQRGRGEWQGAVGAGDLPECEVPVTAQGRERPGGGERLEIAAIERGARGEILDAGEGAAAARCDQAGGAGLRQRLHHAQPEPQRRRAVGAPLERGVPAGGADVDRAHLDAVRARIAHQLRRGVEAHGLAVEQRAGEGRRLVALQPGGVVHQERETHGVRIVNNEVVRHENCDPPSICRSYVVSGFQSSSKLHDLVPVDVGVCEAREIWRVQYTAARRSITNLRKPIFAATS